MSVPSTNESKRHRLRGLTDPSSLIRKKLKAPMSWRPSKRDVAKSGSTSVPRSATPPSCVDYPANFILTHCATNGDIPRRSWFPVDHPGSFPPGGWDLCYTEDFSDNQYCYEHNKFEEWRVGRYSKVPTCETEKASPLFLNTISTDQGDYHYTTLQRPDKAYTVQSNAPTVNDDDEPD